MDNESAYQLCFDRQSSIPKFSEEESGELIENSQLRVISNGRAARNSCYPNPNIVFLTCRFINPSLGRCSNYR